MIRRCLITSLLLLAADLTWAQPIQDWIRMKAQTPRGYQCRRTTTPVAIDGRLDDAAWRQASWTQEFLDIQGPHLPKPKFATRAKMLWDSEYFYIAALLKEPHVWGTLTNRDAVIFQDNDFEVFIDPDGDGHEYFEFEMNALNTQWDLRLVKAYKDGGPALNEWDIVGIKTVLTPAIPASAGRPLAGRFFAGRMANRPLVRPLRQGPQEIRGQLGLVPYRHHRHAPTGSLGHRGICVRGSAKAHSASQCRRRDPRTPHGDLLSPTAVPDRASALCGVDCRTDSDR